MSPPQAIQTDIDFVLGNLRVPDLSYIASSNDDLDSKLQDFINRLAVSQSHHEAPMHSLVALLKEHFGEQPLPAGLCNSAFVIDRSFEIWQRRSNLDPVLVAALSSWRASILIGFLSTKADEIVDLVDFVCKRFIGWCENPSRTKKVVPELLYDAGTKLCDVTAMQSESGVVVQEAHASLLSHLDTSSAKSEKLAYRLLGQEIHTLKSGYAGAIAGTFINQSFNGRQSSESAYRFISDYWFKVLKSFVQSQSESTLSGEIVTLTKRFRAVFVERGKAAMKYSEDLLEDLEARASEFDIAVPSELWSALSAEMIDILKGEPLETVKFSELSCFEKSTVYSSGSKPLIKEGVWLVEESSGHRMQLYQYFENFGHYLFINHLGMKMLMIAETPLKERLASKQLEKMKAPLVFSDVLRATTNGLITIATKQQARRQEAADKAREEADRLLKERQEAAELAQQKAEEISRRSQQIQDKKNSAQKDEARSKSLELIAKLKLGAWVSIGEAEQQRFKLAVKFAASGRYIFVDKYGVKKIEYKELELADKISGGDIKVLNDGADFDASLERVIGRIRMAQ